MKKIILSMAICLGLTSAAWSQTEVHLLINHKISGASLNSRQTGSNDLGNQFQIQRLDYYLAEITLYHDGGQETNISDHYILVKALKEGPIRFDSLGNYAITQLDSIRFGIGVDGSRNNTDIATYPADHPLSFQSPSMHWGWAAGYRFVAVEGLTGSNMSLGWQVHALGNSNYGYATVITSGTQSGNDLTIALDADYEKAFSGILVDGSLNYHGTSNQAVSLLDNFKTAVFSAGSGAIGLSENAAIEWSLYPNPSNGICQIEIPANESGMSVEVRDLSGSLMKVMALENAKTTIEMEAAGIYLLSLRKDQTVLSTQKLIIQ